MKLIHHINISLHDNLPSETNLREIKDEGIAREISDMVKPCKKFPNLTH